MCVCVCVCVCVSKISGTAKYKALKVARKPLFPRRPLLPPLIFSFAVIFTQSTAVSWQETADSGTKLGKIYWRCKYFTEKFHKIISAYYLLLFRRHGSSPATSRLLSRQYTAWSRPSTRLVSTANTIGDRYQHICREGLSNPVTVIYCKINSPLNFRSLWSFHPKANRNCGRKKTW